MQLMRSVFAASLICHGILGGTLILDEDRINYRTGKVTVDEKYRDLRLRLEQTADWKTTRKGPIPLVVIRMKNNEEYTFLIFGRKKFLRLLEEYHRNVPGQKILQKQ